MTKFKVDRQKICNYCEKYATNNYFIYHESFENLFSSKKPKMKRRLFYTLYFLNLTVQIFKMAILMKYQDRHILFHMGEIFHVMFAYPNLVYAFILSIGMVTFVCQTMLAYYEFVDVKAGQSTARLLCNVKMQQEEFFRLNHQNERKLILYSVIIYWVYVKAISKFVFYMAALFYILVSISVVHTHYNNYNIALVFNTVSTVMAIRHMISLSLWGTLCCFIPVTFLNYKFGELIMAIRQSLTSGHTTSLYLIMARYDRLVKESQVFSKFFNVVIGVVQFIVPCFAGLSLDILQRNDDSLIERLFRLFTVLVFLLSLVNAYIYNLIAASITGKKIISRLL